MADLLGFWEDLHVPPFDLGHEVGPPVSYGEHSDVTGGEPVNVSPSEDPTLRIPPGNPMSRHTSVEQTKQLRGRRFDGSSTSSAINSIPKVRSNEEEKLSPYELGIPTSLVHELVDEFFCKVQNFLPLFHRPRFYDQYMSEVQRDTDYHAAGLDAALIINGVAALAARYSTSPYFRDVAPAWRGDEFGRKAKEIYDTSVATLETPTLPFLQGCILLAFHLLSSGSGIQGWMICGTVSRIAYDMGLDALDGPSSGCHLASGVQWTTKEELRRAWWCVWELEVVASTMYRRPHTSLKARAQVMLPVSDSAWWADEEVPSAIVSPHPLQAWQTLHGCANQDERAWFLVGNYLIFYVHDMLQRSCYSSKDIQEIETAITGFAQLLPEQFCISSGVVFDRKCFGKANWIMSTLLMLEGSRVYVKLLKQCAMFSRASDHHNGFLAHLPTSIPPEDTVLNYSRYTQNVMEILNQWPPAFIAMNTPFIAALFLGPVRLNLRVLRHHESIDSDERMPLSTASSQQAILRLVVEKVARYWRFGSLLLNEFDTNDHEPRTTVPVL